MLGRWYQLEADIPGASLEGWAPEALKIAELVASLWGYRAIQIENKSE